MINKVTNKSLFYMMMLIVLFIFSCAKINEAKSISQEFTNLENLNPTSTLLNKSNTSKIEPSVNAVKISDYQKKIGDFVISDKEESIFIRTENTAIKINDVKNLTENDFKKKIKSEVWTGSEKEKKYIENYDKDYFASDRVTLDSEQLSTIQKAEQYNASLPYPLDLTVTYKKGSETKKLIKRTWVFILSDKDKQNDDFVIYADNFTIPIKSVEKITKQKLLKEFTSNINVYTFSYQPQDSNLLIPITNANLDGTKNGLDIDDKEFELLKNATESQKNDNFSIKYSKDNKTIDTKVTSLVEDGTVNFTLLRNKDEVQVTDFVSTLVNTERFKSFEIRIPKNMSIKNFDSQVLPANWFSYQNSSTKNYDSYGFAMGINNDISVIQNFIENNLIFTLNSDLDTSGEIEFVFHERIYTSYNHPDGSTHYYSFTPEVVHFDIAYNRAKQMTYKGLTGYLATITSLEEHDFIFEKIAKVPGWLGGTRRVKPDGKKVLDDFIFPENHIPGNEFYWVNGPEAGQVYFDAPTRFADGGKAPDEVYDGWTSYEPNNTGGYEDTMQFAVNNSKLWNDIAYTATHPEANQGFYVEYSEYDRQKETEFDDHDVLLIKKIPQKIKIKGKDTAGNLLSETDTIIDTNLKIGNIVTYNPPSILDYDYVKTINSQNKKVDLTFQVTDKAQNLESIYRANAKFCFKLERNKETLSFVDLTLDNRLSNMYESMIIEVPSFVSLIDVPSSWSRLPDKTTTSNGGAKRNLYRFNMKGKNKVSDIQSFLEGIKMDIGNDNIDTPDSIKVYLHEEEQLSDAKTKSISKSDILKSSTVIESGDFELYTESKWDDKARRNYVELEWDKVPNLSENGYKMYQSVDGKTFEIRSIKYDKAIKVLNIYPNLVSSNTLKGWMDGLGLKDTDGNNLIQVTPVTISEYNTNPDKYLKDNKGNYQYDVLMFGSWDSNDSQDLNMTSANATIDYLESGRGVLFGHDTVRPAFPNFLKVGNYNNAWISSSMYFPIQGHNEVQIVNDGYLMKYPFEMENKQKMTIPYAHNQQTFVKENSKIWLKFSGYSGNWSSIGYESDTLTNNVYLATNNNTALIQTGHSNSASTSDERMIIANTLYNLAQVGLEENGYDYTVKDDVAPDIIKEPIRDMKNNVTIEGIDFGKEYHHYITAETKDKGLLKSDIVKTEVISDLQGYVYMIDENPNTVPDITKDAYGRVTNINAPVVSPETDRSIKISGFSKESEYLHIIPIDRANNVGDVKHYKMENIDYDDTPSQTSCQHSIPQKIYIKGKDTFGRSIPEGDKVIDTKLRINKQITFDPINIKNYEYVELQNEDKSIVPFGKINEESVRKDLVAIYRRKSAKIHIKQQILNPNDTVVVPKQGYASLFGANLTAVETSTLTIPFNSSDQSNQSFTDYDIEIEDDKTLLVIKDIVPMYYDLKGYVVSTIDSSHNVSQATPTFNPIDLNDHPEIWVTVYLKPSVKDSAFYGWMYGQSGQYTVK